MRRYSILPILTGCLLAAMLVVLAYAGPKDTRLARPELPRTLTPVLSVVEYPTAARIDQDTHRSFGSFQYFPSTNGNLTFRMDVTVSGSGLITTTIGTVSTVIPVSPECGPTPCALSASAVVPYTVDPYSGLGIDIDGYASPIVGQGLTINRLVISLVR